MKDKQLEELREEFNKLFVTLDGDYPIIDPNRYSGKDVADFWLSKIKSRDEELLAKIEELDRWFDEDKGIGSEWNTGYHKALSDLKDYMEREKR